MSCLDTATTTTSTATAAEPSFDDGLSMAVDRALRHLDLPPGLPEQIKACDSVLQLHFPVGLDDYRTAAYVLAIRKIANTYLDLGI